MIQKKFFATFIIFSEFLSTFVLGYRNNKITYIICNDFKIPSFIRCHGYNEHIFMACSLKPVLSAGKKYVQVRECKFYYFQFCLCGKHNTH